MLNVIYDATFVAKYFKKDAARSGIFFVTWNILNHMLLRKDVNVYLYFALDKYAEGFRVKRDLFPNALYAQNLSSFGWLSKLNLFFWKMHGKLYSKVLFRKPFALGILVTQKILSVLAKNQFDKDVFKNANAFFSPAYRVPDLVREFPNIKSYLVLHDAIPFKIPLFKDIGWSHDLREIMRTGRNTDFFFCISKSTLHDFKEIYALVNEKSSKVIGLAASEKLKENRNPLLLEKVRLKYRIPEKKQFVFSLCTLEPRKNLIRAIKTFVLFCKKNKVSNLVWVLGGGHWENFIGILNKEIAGLNEYADLIVHAGYIDDDDLAVLYSNAEWFVYTSQYEGFGLPPLEAMQCGCPVITSNNSSLPEVVGDAGITIDWDSDDQHIAAYEKYYFDENLRKENSRKGLERAKMFSWEKTVNAMVEVMKNAV